MSETGWFADIDLDMDIPGFNRWVAVLQVPGCCFPLPVWFRTKEECERFIREEVVGQPMLPTRDEAPAHAADGPVSGG